MTPKTEATIYLADQRGCTQVDWYRSYHTFNYGTYFREHRRPFRNLQVLNDNTLKEGSNLKQHVKENSIILILPIVGSVRYKNKSGIDSLIEVGQAHFFFASKDSEFEFSNLYENELINFLHIELSTHLQLSDDTVQKFEFDLDGNRNQLIPLHPNKEDNQHQNTLAWIGKFKGRQEGTHSLKNASTGVFIFVIEGAFEVQNRLLHARDGLALSNIDAIEFEALSNDAILLVIE
ncbi:MAG: pirin [Chryseolinea sp.]